MKLWKRYREKCGEKMKEGTSKVNKDNDNMYDDKEKTDEEKGMKMAHSTGKQTGKDHEERRKKTQDEIKSICK